jgi:hypothetical protein
MPLKLSFGIPIASTEMMIHLNGIQLRDDPTRVEDGLRHLDKSLITEGQHTHRDRRPFRRLNKTFPDKDLLSSHPMLNSCPDFFRWQVGDHTAEQSMRILLRLKKTRNRESLDGTQKRGMLLQHRDHGGSPQQRNDGSAFRPAFHRLPLPVQTRHRCEQRLKTRLRAAVSWTVSRRCTRREFFREGLPTGTCPTGSGAGETVVGAYNGPEGTCRKKHPRRRTVDAIMYAVWPEVRKTRRPPGRTPVVCAA